MSSRGLAKDEISKEKNDITGFKALLSYGAGYKRELSLNIFVLVVASIILMSSSYFLGLMIQEISTLKNNGSYESVVWFAGLFLFAEIAAFILKWRGSLGMIRTSIAIVLDLRKTLFQKLSLLPMKYFDRQPMGRTITRATSDVQGVETLFSNSLFRILRSAIQLVSVLVAMLILSPKLGMMVVLSSLPAILINIYAKNFTRYWMRELKVRGARVNSKIAENLNGLSVIKAFGLENWSLKKLNELLEVYLSANIRLNNINSLIRPLTVVLSSIPSLITLLVGGFFVLEGRLDLAIYVAFLRYTEMFLSPIRILSYEIQQIQNAFSSAERVKVLLEEEVESDIFSHNTTVDQRLDGNIEFKNLSFSYDGEKNALNDVSFNIKRGEKIGIVGQTGSGKTSTVSLLARLYDFQSGDILLDGRSIKDFDLKGLRQQIGFVSQDPVIFRGTIRENILSAVKDSDSFTDGEIFKYAKRTGLYDTLTKLPGCLDYKVLDNGLNLSLGEKQLINFTRILLRDPSILILDEATANTDEETEELIHDAVNTVMENRTCLIIAHRLGTIKDCDRVLVFEQGKLVEKGTHDELASRPNGFYTQLVQHQL